MSPKATSVSDLSLPLLANILSRLSNQERLRSAACVSSSWRTAAATATAHLHCSVKRIPSLQQWLAMNCAHAAVQSIHVANGYPEDPKLQLPVQHLQHLTRLNLFGSTITAVQSTGSAVTAGPAAVEAVEHPLGLAPLTALKELTLRECDISLQGLSALTGLRHLDLIEINGVGPPQASSIEELAAALPALQHLTRLLLEGVECYPATEQLHNLPCLQWLALCGPCSPSGLQEMPASLTHLELWLRRDHDSVPKLSPTTTPGLCQLTGLKCLEVHGAPSFSVALLSNLTGLQALDLGSTQLAGPGSLSVLTALTQLRRLRTPISRLLQPVLQSQADTAAITASSQLTYLDITDSFSSGPEALAVFQGRHLPALEVLCASTPHIDDILTASHIRRCCKNLEEMTLRCPVVDQPNDNMATGIGSGLLLWMSPSPDETLTILRLGVGGLRVEGLWHTLADMSGLRCLHIDGLAAADLPGMLELARCSFLTELRIMTVWQPLERGNISIKAMAGEDGMANIPQQLHELLRDALLKQSGNIDPDQLRTLLDLEATVQRQQRQQIGELRAELAEVEASAQQQMASLQQQLQEAQQQQAQLQQQVRDLQQSSEPC